MTLFHDYFNTRNQQAFQRLLASSIEAASSSGNGSSTGKSPGSSSSWKRPSSLTVSHMSACNAASDVNARDYLGRTVLHLACSASAQECVEYVRLLLKHPHIQVNLPDRESQWTALHRALYNGNIAIVLLLLQHPEIEPQMKDYEGYTAFDLYNSTVQGTKPYSEKRKGDISTDSEESDTFELFMWGTNRNAALGLGDASDRVYPDEVNVPIHPSRRDSVDEKASLAARFTAIRVRQVAMSKLHTVIVTDESGPDMNIRVCGFGSGGRLGSSQHTQYSLIPITGAPSAKVVQVAIGQDHTLALTDQGEVYSWGLNRFSQLGYVIETPSTRNDGEQVQITPRRILGPFKKERMKGVVASKCASCAWTEDGEIYTWGTNHGQLGYDRNAQPVQVQPRKASRITKAVIDVAMTDSAMACLVETHEVICVWRDMHFKINFPTQSFPATIQPYRPPPAGRQHRATITKIVSSEEGSFAALSATGEVHTFSVPHHTDTTLTKEDIKPQLAWALRKQFTSVKDVALGSEGSIILCTESGHVYIRDRSGPVKRTSGSGKWSRVPYIQRAVGVSANSTGSFAVLRKGFVPHRIGLHGSVVQEDFARVAPFLWSRRDEPLPRTGADALVFKVPESLMKHTFPMDDGPAIDLHDEEDAAILHDIRVVRAMARFFRDVQHSPSEGELPIAADMLVRVGASFIPVHRALLACRSRVLATALSGGKVNADKTSGMTIKLAPSSTSLPVLSFSNVQALTVLLLLVYLYTDDVPAVWDLRVLSLSEPSLSSIKFKGGPEAIKAELVSLARLLDLPALGKTLEAPGKRHPSNTLVQDLVRLHQRVQGPDSLSGSPLSPDVVLHLTDRDIFTHSIILRARSPFFEAFFAHSVWTERRRGSGQNLLEVDMRHLRWHSMQYVLRYLVSGEDESMFRTLPFVNSSDEVLEFMFEVMGAASELLLDRLILICSRVIQRYTNTHNACYILTDATHYHAMSLVDRVQSYMAANLEGFLESHLLSQLSPAIIKDLSAFVRQKQSEKMKLDKMQEIIETAMIKHKDWLAQEDFPEPVLRSMKHKGKGSPRLSPKLGKRRSTAAIPPLSPLPQPADRSQATELPKLPVDDDLFMMDEPDTTSGTPTVTNTGLSSPAAWKLPSAPRVEMKSLLAEEAEKALGSPSKTSGLKFSQRPSQKERRKAQVGTAPPPPPVPAPAPAPASVPATRSTSSPWKPVPVAQPAPSPLRPPTSTPPTAPPSVHVQGSSKQTPSTPPRSQAQRQGPDLGPVITPSRHPSSRPSEGPRRVSSSSTGHKAWTLPPVQPVVMPTGGNGGMSLVAIQQLELEQNSPAGRDKRSLLEIQQEEVERQQETDFLRWWAEEEERVKQETEAAAQQQQSATKPSPGKGRKKKQSGPALTASLEQREHTRASRPPKPRKSSKQSHQQA